MKKVMFVVVMVLVASTCFAQLQSPPSNVTGYVKITGVASSYTPFGLPFKFWDVPAGGIPTYGTPSTSPSDILGDQLNCGSISSADQIIRQDGGAIARRQTPSCAWAGTLESGAGMISGHAFFYQNRTASNRDIVLAGEVDNTGNYGGVVMSLATYNPYSWRDSRALNRANLNLLLNGFRGGTVAGTSDQVVAQTGGSFFWRRTSDNTWQGTLGGVGTELQPGQAYFIYNRAQTGDVAWTYTYDASGVGLSVGNSPKNDSGTPISKVTAPRVEKTSKNARN